MNLKGVPENGSVVWTCSSVPGKLYMEFFNSAVDVLQTLVTALGGGLGIWGVVNLLEGYGNDNPGAKSTGFSRQ